MTKNTPKNEPQQNLLDTKIKDLTPEILAKLEKPLGTASRPFPMWGTQRVDQRNSSEMDQVLSAIASDTMPMQVYSDRSYAEVVAMAYCDMPVPSMLPLFFDGLERRKPESHNRAQFLIGDPGFGKSFMGALQGRMRSTKPVEVFDCGGKNMNDLLFEMVLDFGAGDALPQAIDKRLKSGMLQALSYAKLKQLPKGALTMDGDEIKAIDWNYFKGTAVSAEVDQAFSLLKQISAVEGLDNAGGNALGMNSQYGTLIRWFLENREGVLDEYNKSKEGTDNALQTVWQFINGEIDSCTVENPLKNKDASAGPSSFTFKREDMGIGFFVTLTGNKTEDGTTTRSLNKSVYSRLSPQTLPDPGALDWQHRICQMMVGIPVSTLYTVFKDQADAQPEAFGKWLMDIRKAKAQMEGTPLSPLQESLLLNWQNVVSASEKLAKFYDKWATVTNAEKIMQGHTDLIDEVDEEYTKKEGVDFRKVKQHLEEAAVIRPRMEPADTSLSTVFKDFLTPPKPAAPVEENPALGFGTRLVEFLERLVYEKSGAVGKTKLYGKLMQAMKEFGLRDINLAEAAHSQQKSVEEALNISAFGDRDPKKQAELAQKVFCNYLRSVDPKLSARDEDIITAKKLRDALAIAAAAKAEGAKELFVVNSDVETLNASPLFAAHIEDYAAYIVAGKEIDLDFDDLVGHDDFMAALALPTVSGVNLAAIWDGNLRPLLEEPAPAANDNADAAATPKAPDNDEALHIAENTSEQKIATTSLRVKFNEQDVSVHIVRNEARNKTLVIGEAIPEKLKAAFKEAGIIHVDRNEANALSKVEAALNDLTRNMPDTVRGRLVEAFKYRNARFAANDQGEAVEVAIDKSADLAELLVDKSLEMRHGKYVMKSR